MPVWTGGGGGAEGGHWAAQDHGPRAPRFPVALHRHALRRCLLPLRSGSGAVHWCRLGWSIRGHVVVPVVVIIIVIGAAGDSIQSGGVRECDLSGGGRRPATDRRPGGERGATHMRLTNRAQTGAAGGEARGCSIVWVQWARKRGAGMAHDGSGACDRPMPTPTIPTPTMPSPAVRHPIRGHRPLHWKHGGAASELCGRVG